MKSDTVGVLFVCMGNICRSPTAEGVFTRLVVARGYEGRIAVDSAGTLDYHTGDAPDERAQETALRYGIDIGHLRARQVRSSDFERFRYVLAMDTDNLQYLTTNCPSNRQDRLGLMLDFASDADTREVPDPYYGGRQGFDRVYTMIQDASEGLLTHIAARHFDE